MLYTEIVTVVYWYMFNNFESTNLKVKIIENSINSGMECCLCLILWKLSQSVGCGAMIYIMVADASKGKKKCAGSNLDLFFLQDNCPVANYHQAKLWDADSDSNWTWIRGVWPRVHKSGKTKWHCMYCGLFTFYLWCYLVFSFLCSIFIFFSFSKCSQ